MNTRHPVFIVERSVPRASRGTVQISLLSVISWPFGVGTTRHNGSADLVEPQVVRDGLAKGVGALRRREPDIASGARDGVVRHADDDSWLVLHRGAIRVAVNLSAGPASVQLAMPAGPGGIGPVEVLLAWDAVTVQCADAHLPGRSVAVIRCAGRL